MAFNVPRYLSVIFFLVFSQFRIRSKAGMLLGNIAAMWPYVHPFVEALPCPNVVGILSEGSLSYLILLVSLIYDKLI